MLDPSTISQLVGVVLMMSPSPTDNHVMNYSLPLVMFETEEDCQLNRTSLLKQNIVAITPDTREISEIYFWCKPVWNEDK